MDGEVPYEFQGMSAMQNLMIIGLVFSCFALYLRHKIRQESHGNEKGEA